MTSKRSPMSRPGNQSGLVHGARSPAQIAAKARAHRRRFLRRIGLRASDLDALAAEYLALWATGKAQLDLREAGEVDHGRDYWTAYNATKRALEKLEKRLHELGLDRGPDKGSELERILAEHDRKGRHA